MQITAHADVDVVALEQTDEVHVLLELRAPAAPDTGQARPEHTAVVVLDRSGSMAGDRLEHAKEALVRVVGRLDDRDRFGLVTFDDSAEVMVPAGTVGEVGRERIVRAIRAISPGGMTDVSAGYFRGLQEARRVCSEAGATLILVSDGHANSGVTDPTALGQTAARAATRSITTSTVGMGDGYDDSILDALATSGQGNHGYAHDGDGAAFAISTEVDGLLSKTVQAAHLIVRPTADVREVEVLNDVPSSTDGETLVVELGDLYAGETRRLSLRLVVPGMGALGLAQIAELSVGFVSLPQLTQHTVTIPVQVNVVPADVARGRVRDPKVVEESLFAEVQRDKKRSVEALGRGDLDGARRHLHTARDLTSSMPESVALQVEADWIDATSGQLQHQGISHASKRLRSNLSKTRRGSMARDAGGEIELPNADTASPGEDPTGHPA
ncbi:MAG: VWA domain-containing protein [Humibacillus sp.]